MGCPVPKVVNNGEGSALLKNPDPVSYTHLRTSDDSVTIPVDTEVIIKAVHGVKLIVEPKEA